MASACVRASVREVQTLGEGAYCLVVDCESAAD